MPQRFVNRDTMQVVAQELGAVAAAAGRLLACLADRACGLATKSDGSPATDADRASERLILDALAARFPDVPVVAEEAGAAPHPHGCFFLVDPLDGTRDFLSGSGEYAVCIALVHAGRPAAAAIAVPDAGRVWIAGESAAVATLDDAGDFGWRPVATRTVPAEGLTILGSRRHGDEDTERGLACLPVAHRRLCSSALKFCLVASGEADLYLRCGPTMEWDTAAGDLIVARAGGAVVDAAGEPLRYGRTEAGYRNGPFAALGDPAWIPRLPPFNRPEAAS